MGVATGVTATALTGAAGAAGEAAATVVAEAAGLAADTSDAWLADFSPFKSARNCCTALSPVGMTPYITATPKPHKQSNAAASPTQSQTLRLGASGDGLGVSGSALGLTASRGGILGGGSATISGIDMRCGASLSWGVILRSKAPTTPSRPCARACSIRISDCSEVGGSISQFRMRRPNAASNFCFWLEALKSMTTRMLAPGKCCTNRASNWISLSGNAPASCTIQILGGALWNLAPIASSIE